METNYLNLPKLHLVCGYYKKPVLDFILITKNHIVTTNAYVVVVHEIKSFFDDNFISKIPERLLIHKEQWKIICRKTFFLKYENDSIVANKEDYEIAFPVKFESEGFKFPDYQILFDNMGKKGTRINKIGIDPKLLNLLCDGMFVKNDIRQVKFEFFGESRAIKVTPINNNIGQYGLIMPVAFFE